MRKLLIPLLFLAQAFCANAQVKEVVLEEGTYNIVRPWTYGPQDSDLIVRGAGRGRTIVSGGIELPPFTPSDGGLWCIDLKGAYPLGADIQQLFVSGERAVPARTPDEGSYFHPGGCDETVFDEGAGRKGLAVQAIHVGEDAAAVLSPLAGPDYPELTVAFLHSWDITRKPVLAFDPESRRLFVSGHKMHPWNEIARPGCSQFYFEGNAAFLDAPGEFFHDAEANILYYVPREGEDISTARAVVPTTERLLAVAGTAGSPVRNITFEGITFQYTAFNTDWHGNDPAQGAWPTGAAIEIDHASGIRFVDCEIAHTGSNAIWFREDCTDCSLERSYLHDLGISAVKIGVPKMPADEGLLTKHITVDNNILRAGSRVLPTGEGVTLFHASDCAITHNEVADFYYSGMSIGWRWGYEHSPSKRNKILYNHIHHIGWGVLSDMGGVYTLGPSEGTEVSFNCIHDIYSFEYGGWGLYTDEGSTGITMEGNLVYNCKSSAFHQHYGKDNHITNNLFVNSIRAQLEATRVEDHVSFIFDRNIIVYKTGDMHGHNWETVNFKADNNVYWHTGGEVSFNGLSLAEWRAATGKDVHSIVADPGIGDFSGGVPVISNRKLLRKIGFVVPDWSVCGVYGDASWSSLAAFDPARAALFDETVANYESWWHSFLIHE